MTQTLALWHEILSSGAMHRLDEVLAEDCVFISPVLHTPQAGRELTKKYLGGAFQVFNDSFHYVKEVVDGPYAVLEFECDLDGIIVNGVDIMTFDEAGMISEFKVMVRPLKAVHLLQQRMQSMLERLSA
ncbi:MAG: nuclear transport factor 2 family protein [Halioglobus sp.]